MLTKRREGHSRIPEIVSRVTCFKHEADKNQPCWYLGGKPAICNHRAERAGFIIPTDEQLQERRRQAKNRRG